MTFLQITARLFVCSIVGHKEKRDVYSRDDEIEFYEIYCKRCGYTIELGHCPADKYSYTSTEQAQKL